MPWLYPTELPPGSVYWRVMTDGRFDWSLGFVVYTEDNGETLCFLGARGELPPLRWLLEQRDKHHPRAIRARFERCDPATGEFSQHEWPLPPFRS